MLKSSLMAKIVYTKQTYMDLCMFVYSKFALFASSVNDKSPVYAGSLQISNSVSNPPSLMKER